MKKFIIYEENTGKLLRTGICPSANIGNQPLKSTEKIIEVVDISPITIANKIIVNGQLKEIS